MPAQPRLLPQMTPGARAPGAINLTPETLSGDDILRLTTVGAVSAQTTLTQLQLFFIAPFYMPARVVTTIAESEVEDTDVVLLINKTIASATSLVLPTPVLSRVLVIKDMAGNSESNNITLDAGSGKLINGLQTLVMNANYGTTMLIGMSATKWGTLI